MGQVAEGRGPDLAGLGVGVGLVCREGLIKEEKLQLNLGGSGGVCDIGAECRSTAGRTASAKTGSKVWSEEESPPECRGGACPGSLEPTNRGRLLHA